MALHTSMDDEKGFIVCIASDAAPDRAVLIIKDTTMDRAFAWTGST